MNIDISQFHFIRPLFLYLFIVLAWFIWRTYRYSQNSNAWTKACDPGLLSYLLVGVEKKKGWLHFVLLSIVGSLIIVAMAGPTWEKLPQAVYKKESARVFVLDLSRSMDSTDVSPDRTSRAKLKLIDFLNTTDEGMSALVVYANNPHIVSPLTDDSNTIISMVPSLSPAIMPSSGGRVDKAIMKAAQLLTQAGNADGDIVIFTDGVNLTLASAVAEKIVAAGFSLNVIGVGTEQGAPIPDGVNGFLKDAKGTIVIPKLNRSDLKKLALAGAGIYSDISIDDTDIQRLKKRELNQNLQKNSPFVREVDLWRDQGHLFLLLALPFAALAFRRGWLGAVLAVVLVAPPQDAYAMSWDDLWLNKNQQAEKALNSGDTKAAADLFDNADWKGTSEYQSGNYEEAESQFSKSDTAESYYNLGNALARQGKLPEAIEAYNNTLERNPNHKDAQFNKELVEKIKKEQENEQESDENKKSDDESQDKDGKDQESKDQDGKDQESKDKDQQEGSDKDSQDQKNADEQSEEKKQADKKQAEKEAEEKAQQEAEQKKRDEQGEDDQSKDKQEIEKNTEQKEIEQATEQWLRRIPDDPGGLLREKMRRQNLRDRGRSRTDTENQW